MHYILFLLIGLVCVPFLMISKPFKRILFVSALQNRFGAPPRIYDVIMKPTPFNKLSKL